MSDAPSSSSSAVNETLDVDIEGAMQPTRIVTEAISSSSLGSSAQSDPGTTLDEPVLTTVCRDLHRVAIKLRHVLIPARSGAETLRELRDWDLWGPLLLCLILSLCVRT